MSIGIKTKNPALERGFQWNKSLKLQIADIY